MSATLQQSMSPIEWSMLQDCSPNSTGTPANALPLSISTSIRDVSRIRMTVDYSRNGSFTCQGSLGASYDGRFTLCLGIQNESADNDELPLPKQPIWFYHALRLMSCSAATARSAVLRTGLCVLTRFGAESIAASLTERGILLAVVVYSTSRSKSNRHRSECYCDSCYSEVFHTRSPLNLLILVGLC